MTIDQLANEALKLSPEDRTSLAACLVEGLRSPICQLTDDEISRCMVAADRDPGVMISVDEVVGAMKKNGHWEVLPRCSRTEAPQIAAQRLASRFTIAPVVFETRHPSTLRFLARQISQLELLKKVARSCEVTWRKNAVRSFGPCGT